VSQPEDNENNIHANKNATLLRLVNREEAEAGLSDETDVERTLNNNSCE